MCPTHRKTHKTKLPPLCKQRCHVPSREVLLGSWEINGDRERPTQERNSTGPRPCPHRPSPGAVWMLGRIGVKSLVVFSSLPPAFYSPACHLRKQHLLEQELTVTGWPSLPELTAFPRVLCYLPLQKGMSFPHEAMCFADIQRPLATSSKQ